MIACFLRNDTTYLPQQSLGSASFHLNDFSKINSGQALLQERNRTFPDETCNNDCLQPISHLCIHEWWQEQRDKTFLAVIPSYPVQPPPVAGCREGFQMADDCRAAQGYVLRNWGTHNCTDTFCASFTAMVQYSLIVSIISWNVLTSNAYLSPFDLLVCEIQSKSLLLDTKC